ncbi:unnamed protein product [Paramecium pentaurelia]|uniref:Proteasome endopeptidase complex n=1 Tax=Paramecium pentaurelia TaxID=43138 RepID=A0A8S1SI90_9CILI|nr:unnamed protein product [Paramecium pentaurelia]
MGITEFDLQPLNKIKVPAEYENDVQFYTEAIMKQHEKKRQRLLIEYNELLNLKQVESLQDKKITAQFEKSQDAERTMAGGAADCQYWLAYLANHCRTYELKNGSKLSVAAASKFLQGILIGYRNSGLSMGCMIAGTDTTGQHLYYIDNDGMRLKGDIFSVGSGSTYAYGVLDNHYKYEMSLNEAVELGIRAIYHATHRDTASGGVVRVYHIHQNGWTKVHDGIDVVDLHYQFAQQKGLVGDGDEAKQRLF